MKAVTKIMASLPTSTKQEMLDLMRRLKRVKLQSYHDIEDLTPSEMNVMLSIFMAKKRGKDSIQPRQVARWLHLTPSALSQTLKLLEGKGFIERKRSMEDSRSVSLGLTEKGFQFADKGFTEHDAFMDEFIEYMGEEEVKSLIVSFHKILDFVSEKCSKTSSNKETPCE